MKKILTVLFLFTIQIYCQTYLNVKFTDDSYKYAELTNISSITFNGAGTEMTITLTDASSSTETISSISEITCDASILGGGNPFPVEMTTFYANVVENVVTLNWETATEINNYGFEILRCAQNDGHSEPDLSGEESWEIIGFVEGHGNSNSPKKYSFADENPPSGKIQYRLKQIDTDGSYEYSDFVSVETGIPKDYELKQNFPNPFNPTTKIVYKLAVDGFVTVKVYNVLGHEVASLVNENKRAGTHTIIFDVSNAGGELSSGIYFLRLNSGNYTGLIKMILLR